MRAAPPTPKVLVRKTWEYAKLLNRHLDEYLNEPTADAVHDVRTAIRRVEASHRAFPGKIRREKEMAGFILLSKKLFRTSTPIRDCDIIASKLINECGLPESDRLVLALMTKRTAGCKSANNLGKSLRRTKFPLLDTDDVSRGKLKSRYANLLTRITSRLSREIPIMLSDPARVKELHEVRKRLKRLRYTLELSKNRGALSDAMTDLIGLQDLLGSIHDDDVTVAYLRRAGGSDGTSRARNDLAAKRDEAYRRLVGQYGERLQALVASF